MAISDLDSLQSLASSAIASGDYATALVYVQRIELLLAVTPDVTVGGDGGYQTRFDREGIREFCKSVRLAAASVDGIRTTTVTYANPDSVDSYT